MGSTKKDSPKKKKYTYYKASFVIGKNPNGTYERIYVRGKTKHELEAKLSEAKRLHAKGIQLNDLTVWEWSERWISTYKANVTPTQKAHYDTKLRRDILPVIGSLRMRDIRASHLQKLLNSYAGKKRGTVEKIRHAIRNLFADAIYEGIIERDPSLRLELPTLEDAPRRPLSVAERRAVLEVAKTHPRGVYILTLLYSGLRRGECVALERSDVDLDNRRLWVNKALSLRKNKGNVEGTKASKMRRNAKGEEDIGVRVVPIPDLLLPVLTGLCVGKAPDDLLFPKSDGTYVTKQTVSWWWHSFSRACHIAAGAELYRNAVKYETSAFGADVTPHYMRHTYATDLYAAGVDELARKTFLGHSLSDVTEEYTAMSDEAINRNLELLNRYLNAEKWDKNGAN
jgi:integrase